MHCFELGNLLERQGYNKSMQIAHFPSGMQCALLARTGESHRQKPKCPTVRFCSLELAEDIPGSMGVLPLNALG